jgi:putative transposase
MQNRGGFGGGDKFQASTAPQGGQSEARLPTGPTIFWCGMSIFCGQYTLYSSVQNRHPFETVAICILPNHLHAIWSLPADDVQFPLRWSLIKSGFSRKLPPASLRSPSKIAKREKGIWQRRYWEHAIRDEADLARHIDYIHFNPVKHRLVSRVRDWPHSSFHSFVARGVLPEEWGGDVCEAAGSFGE